MITLAGSKSKAAVVHLEKLVSDTVEQIDGIAKGFLTDFPAETDAVILGLKRPPETNDVLSQEVIRFWYDVIWKDKEYPFDNLPPELPDSQGKRELLTLCDKVQACKSGPLETVTLYQNFLWKAIDFFTDPKPFGPSRRDFAERRWQLSSDIVARTAQSIIPLLQHMYSKFLDLLETIKDPKTVRQWYPPAFALASALKNPDGSRTLMEFRHQLHEMVEQNVDGLKGKKKSGSPATLQSPISLEQLEKSNLDPKTREVLKLYYRLDEDGMGKPRTVEEIAILSDLEPKNIYGKLCIGNHLLGLSRGAEAVVTGDQDMIKTASFADTLTSLRQTGAFAGTRKGWKNVPNSVPDTKSPKVSSPVQRNVETGKGNSEPSETTENNSQGNSIPIPNRISESSIGELYRAYLRKEAFPFTGLNSLYLTYRLGVFRGKFVVGNTSFDTQLAVCRHSELPLHHAKFSGLDEVLQGFPELALDSILINPKTDSYWQVVLRADDNTNPLTMPVRMDTLLTLLQKGRIALDAQDEKSSCSYSPCSQKWKRNFSVFLMKDNAAILRDEADWLQQRVQTWPAPIFECAWNHVGLIRDVRTIRDAKKIDFFGIFCGTPWSITRSSDVGALYRYGQLNSSFQAEMWHIGASSNISVIPDKLHLTVGLEDEAKSLSKSYANSPSRYWEVLSTMDEVLRS